MVEEGKRAIKEDVWVHQETQNAAKQRTSLHILEYFLLPYFLLTA
jgi:hypothetical protein